MATIDTTITWTVSPDDDIVSQGIAYSVDGVEAGTDSVGPEISSYEIGEPISSTPAIINGRILVGCEDGSVYSFKTNPIK